MSTNLIDNNEEKSNNIEVLNLIFSILNNENENPFKIQKKIQEITSMGKEPIIAVIERRGEIIYYKISRIKFQQNIEKINMNDFDF